MKEKIKALFSKLTKKRVIAGVIVLAVLLVAGGAVYLISTWDKMNNDPQSYFNQPPATPEPTDELQTDTPDVTDTESAQPTDLPTPTATLSPFDDLNSQADQSVINDSGIRNILLIGVDWADERVDSPKGYKGKNFNSDVMLDLAVNFKQNKVDMISVPRDSYARIANIPGNYFYKLNFALSAGDSDNITDKAFMNVCKSVQYLFDATGKAVPPVDWYIAVTMPVVKELVDDVGGVDYDVDVAFTIDGRAYKKGMQHMDGQGVLDYCRIRKGTLSADFGDLNRVNRQKKMLLAVFQKLQTTSSLLNVPKILTSMQGKVFTNMTFNQLAALTVFGSKLPADNIKMHTIPGSYDYGIFNKNYVLIDQTQRVQLIKQVFGVTVAPEYIYGANFAKLKWAYMQGTTWLKDIQTVLSQDAAKPVAQQKFTDPVQLAKLTDMITATQSMMNKYKSRVNSTKATASTNEYKELQAQVLALKALAQPMISKAGYKVKSNWAVTAPQAANQKMAE